jgi:phosphate transport system protein
MSEHFHNELDEMREDLLEQGKRVEEQITGAIEAMLNRDEERAKEVIDSDREIDEAEIEIEEECLKLLALYQPIASDLRFLMSALKINNDLERIADLASNICERVIYISSHNKLDTRERFEDMTKRVQEMIRTSMSALIERDEEKAWTVRDMDDEVDRQHEEMFQFLTDEIKKNSEVTEVAIQNLSASRYLERIADHATNIAEDVIYMERGEIVRHQSSD